MSKQIAIAFALLLAAPPAWAAPGVLTEFVLERGGNLESLQNERILIRYDGRVVYERGRAVTRKDAQYGTVTDGVCERYTWSIETKGLDEFRAVVDNAGLAALKPSYHRPGVEDGSQAGLLAIFTDVAVVSRFDNEFPPAYRAVSEYLTSTVLKDVEKKRTTSRCDFATWLFIRPPNDRR